MREHAEKHRSCLCFVVNKFKEHQRGFVFPLKGKGSETMGISTKTMMVL